jgi:AcrR family transcriptional regulator
MSVARSRPSLRADARLNREKLLGAAAELFASVGVDVSLEAVAKQAGLGIGTLYRHFPTRDALVEAVYRQEVDRLCGAADELLSSSPPDVALEAWMRRFVTYAAAKRGMAGALQSIYASDAELYASTRARLLTAMSTLLRAAVAAGTVRADMEPEDVLQAMSGVWLIPAGEQWTARAQRLLQLLMDGLRYGATTGRPDPASPSA